MFKMKFKIILFSLCLFAISSFSCKKSPYPALPSGEPETSVSFDKQVLALDAGGEGVIKASFPDNKPHLRSYKWTSSDNSVVTIYNSDVFTATITAVSEGVADVTMASTDGVVSATCTVTVSEGDDGILRVLAIGNSFSEDAVEHYLYGLANAAGKKIIIGNLYIGGAQLSLHLENAINNTASYSYRKIDVDGKKVSKGSSTIAATLNDEPWDYVSFQQASPYSGQYDTYVASLPDLYNYVKANINSSKTKYLLHQTWAYASNSTHSGFANYNKDQMTMYNAIIDAVDRASKLVDIYKVVPSGTAIQNGRASSYGDNFNRDGYHLDLNIGRYTASCTWLESLFGISPVGNTYRPTGLSDYDTAIAQNAAHFANLNPMEINPMVDFQVTTPPPPTTNDIYVGFGSSATETGWNLLTDPEALISVPLKDNSNNTTGLSIQLVSRFNAINNVGASSTTIAGFEIPQSISNSSFYGNSGNAFNGQVIDKGILKLTGLDKTKKYNLCFFSSRGGVSDNRETQFVLNGSVETKVSINASKNTTEAACANEIVPDANGEILITVTSGPNNTNANGFFYINALKISIAD